MSADLHVLTPDDLSLMRGLCAMFGAAFHERDTYTGSPPDAEYLRRLLADDGFIAIAAVRNDVVVGGLVAYVFRKFEQARAEIYIYDLAVDVRHRRQGIATALIERLKPIAVARGAHVIYVQADTGAEDAPAIALYSKLGKREEVLHFDIEVDAESGPSAAHRGGGGMDRS